MLFESKKIGRYSVSIDIIEKNPNIMKKLNSELIIVEALIRPHGSVEYTAICDRFDDMTEGEEIPRYSIDFIMKEDKVRNYSIRRF